MKLSVHSSLWGNIYRHRYYRDGRRVSKQEFDRLLEAMRADGIGPTTKSEKVGPGTSAYRLTYTK